MSEQDQRLREAEFALDQVTREAKELMQRLSEDLLHQTEEREQHRLDAAARNEDDQ